MYNNPACPTCECQQRSDHRCFGMRFKGDPYLEKVYKYWRGKVRNEKSRGIRFLITGPELIQLMEQGGVHPDDIGAQKKGQINLGRIDHGKAYTLDNVVWQTMEENGYEGGYRAWTERLGWFKNDK